MEADPLNIFITRVDASGQRRCGVKDLIDTAGVRTTYGSRVYGDQVPEHDATSWARLAAAGWTLAGKTNLHEFAYGVTSQNQWYGNVGNPHDPGRVAGGSSGGSAAGVATGAFELGLGTDTAGSIRIPAAFCGVVGYKPTFGAVPTDGVFPLIAWLDHIGPIARTVATCAEAFATLAVQPVAREVASSETTIGVPVDPGAVEPSIAAAVGRALERCREAGARIVPVTLPAFPDAILAVRLVAAAFTHRATYPARREEYGANITGKLDRGREPYDHLAALEALAEIEGWKRAFAAATDGVDLVALPTVPVPTPAIDVAEAPLRGEVLRNTQIFNHLGWPSITIPCGPGADGMPVGLMLSGQGDDSVLGRALALEAAITAA